MSRWVLLILSTRCRARYWNESLVDGLGRFCAETFDEARFVDRTRLSPLGPRTGVFLTVDAATDAQTQQRVVLKRAPDGMAIHLANDLLPNLLNVSGAHVMTATACFDGGATRVAAYERMEGSLVQLLLATNGTDPLPRRDRACFALTAVHQMLRGLAAAHAVGIVNQDVHAGNLLFKGAWPATRWKVSDFGRACLAGARPGTRGCLATAGALAAAPEAGRVALTPASDVWGAGLVFLLLRCAHGLDPARRHGVEERPDRLAARFRELVQRLRRRRVGATLAAAALPAEAARCRLRAEPTREGELLEAMLDPRWEKRPTASWLAGEFADLVRRRCARSRL